MLPGAFLGGKLFVKATAELQAFEYTQTHEAKAKPQLSRRRGQAEGRTPRNAPESCHRSPSALSRTSKNFFEPRSPPGCWLRCAPRQDVVWDEGFRGWGPRQLPVMGRPGKKRGLSTDSNAAATDGLAQGNSLEKETVKNKENVKKRILCHSKPSTTFPSFKIASLKLTVLKQTALQVSP